MWSYYPHRFSEAVRYIYIYISLMIYIMPNISLMIYIKPNISLMIYIKPNICLIVHMMPNIYDYRRKFWDDFLLLYPRKVASREPLFSVREQLHWASFLWLRFFILVAFHSDTKKLRPVPILTTDFRV